MPTDDGEVYGASLPTPPKPPKQTATGRAKAYVDARKQGLKAGEANRYADQVAKGHTNVDIYAGYKTGRGAKASRRYSAGFNPVTADFTAPGSGEGYINRASNAAPFAGLANALLPYLSPEDQGTIRSYLSENYSDLYGDYADAPEAEVGRVTTDTRNQFISADRARNARAAIDNMLSATGVSKKSLGAGYDFLDNIIGTLEKYGSEPMTRARYSEFSREVDKLLKNAEDNPDVSAYAPLGEFFAKPSFGGRDLYELQQNRKLFG